LGNRLFVHALVALVATAQADDVDQRVGDQVLGSKGATRGCTEGPPPVFQSDSPALEQVATRAGELGVKVALPGSVSCSAAAARCLRTAQPGRCGAILGTGAAMHPDRDRDPPISVLFVLDQETLMGPVNAFAEPAWPQSSCGRSPRSAAGYCVRRSGGCYARRSASSRAFVDGQRVLPARATALGFKFQYPTVATALAAMWGAELMPVGLAPGAGGRGAEAALPPPGGAPTGGATPGSATA
jgi:hypothetical protein